LVHKYLEHNVASFNTKILSDESPMVHHIVALQGVRLEVCGNYADAPEGSVAVVALHGDMMKYGTMCSYGTTEIAEQIDEAAASDNIIGIVLDVDSGGGCVDAIAPLTEAIERSRASGKPVVALCDLCASAAYYASLSCNEILAANALSAEFGSIGVMVSFMDYKKYYENAGIQLHTIYSNHSTYKNAPFEAARSGSYDLLKKEELDPLARAFQECVKEKRGEKLNTKVEGILEGRTFYASAALKHGLIDGIGSLQTAADHVRQLSADAKLRHYTSQYAKPPISLK
jgi:protease-4